MMDGSFMHRSKLGVTGPFAAFAVLIALRDITYEIYLKEFVDPFSYAFMIVATIVVVAILGLAIQRNSMTALVAKFQTPGLPSRSLALGALAALVYGVTFFMIHQIGAGVFDLIDYGLTPILTAALGFAFFQDTWRNAYIVSFCLYVGGLIMLAPSVSVSGYPLLFIAILSPLGTSLSDYLSKWLLGSGRLSREELLLVRFLPATLVLLIYRATLVSDSVYVKSPALVLLFALVLGALPLWFLCLGLFRNALTQLAIWEFLIPALAFFGTLYWHWFEAGREFRIVGALLVLVGIAFGATDSQKLSSDKGDLSHAENLEGCS